MANKGRVTTGRRGASGEQGSDYEKITPCVSKQYLISELKENLLTGSSQY